MNKLINPNMHIKQNLNAEIEAWLAQGNAITTIQNNYEQRLKARPSTEHLDLIFCGLLRNSFEPL